MIKFRKKNALVTMVLVASCIGNVAVQAANLSSVQGAVHVSRAGGPFLAVTGPTQINPGDVVRAEVGSSAQVVYANGAVAAVSSGSTMTVAADPAAVLAGVAYQGAPKTGEKPEGDGTGLSNTNTVVLTSVGIIGGGFLAKKLYDDKKKKASASP
jgi:hypothetical protein